MPRYNFHVVGDDGVALHLSRAHFDAYEEAEDQAQLLAGELRKDPKYGSKPQAWRVRVTDEAGASVLTVELSGVSDKAGLPAGR